MPWVHLGTHVSNERHWKRLTRCLTFDSEYMEKKFMSEILRFEKWTWYFNCHIFFQWFLMWYYNWSWNYKKMILSMLGEGSWKCLYSHKVGTKLKIKIEIINHILSKIFNQIWNVELLIKFLSLSFFEL
jgi:hypothetical protein